MKNRRTWAILASPFLALLMIAAIAPTMPEANDAEIAAGKIRSKYISPKGAADAGGFGGGGGTTLTAAAAAASAGLLPVSVGASRAMSFTGISIDGSNNVTGINDMTVTGALSPGSITWGANVVPNANIATTLSAKKIQVSAALGTDDTYDASLQIAGLNAGATIAQWEAVYIGSSSTYLLADANGSGTYPAVGLAVAGYSSTNAAIVVCRGTVRNDAWNWTPGGNIYLSVTAGALTQTAPSTTGDKVQVIGVALTADIMLVNPSVDYGTAP
jgi:hypothetical protein